MWPWLKSVRNFFSGIVTRVRTFFTGEDQRRDQYQPILSELPQQDASEQSGSDQASSIYEQLPNELHVKIFSYVNKDQPGKDKSNFFTGLFSQCPVSAQSALVHTSQRFHNLFQPQRLVDKLLSLAADAEQPAVDKLLAMLDMNPSLLLEKGNVITRGGDEVRGVTVYEFCLGAGDPELAGLIAPYFDKIKDKDGKALDGASERERQYNRYKPYIDAMPSQALYDLDSLIDIITNSPAADVTACLNKNFDHESELNTALKKFREDHAPRIISKPCMHYNYSTLQQALNLLYIKWNALSANDTNYDKCRLVCRQIIGYLQRTLPGIDRIGFARAFQDNKRVLNFFCDRVDRFSDTLSGGDVVSTGLGFDELIFGWAGGEPGGAWGSDGAGRQFGTFQNSCQTKTSNLQSLCSRTELKRPGV